MRTLMITTFSIALFLPGLAAQGILDDIAVVEIRETLGLSEEQASLLADLKERYQEQSAALNGKIPTANSPAARKDLVRKMTDHALACRADVKEILSGEQFAGLQAHHVEWLEANRKADQPDYRNLLNMTPEQALQFLALLSVYQPGIQKFKGELQEAEGLREKRKISKSLKPLREEMDALIEGILDESQYQLWKSIQKERRAEMRKAMM